MNSYIRGLVLELPHPFRKDAERLSSQFDTDINIENGVVRWKENANIPPREILEFWNHIGKPFDYKKSLIQLEKDTNAFLDEYRTKMKGRPRSQEEMYELRANFEPGTKIVNVVTGETVNL